MFILNRLVSLVAPHECLICGAEGTLFCAVCQSEACEPLPERCYRCHVLSADSKTCPSCRRQSKLSNVWVRMSYEHHAKDLVHAFKFERAQDAAVPIAELMIERLPYFSPETIVTHVPTASSRYRQRGYDHAALLAKALSQRVGAPYVSLLARTGQTRQVGSKRSQRTTQLQGAYRVTRPLLVKGRDILLIDDITTTGATLEAAAAVLKSVGAKKVRAAVFAQKQ